MTSVPTPVPAAPVDSTRSSRAGAAKPLVVALIGLPGSGKSVVARAISDQLGLRRVDRDAIRHAMFPRCSYSFVEKRASFRALLLAVEMNCMLGESSVIDGCTFSRRADLVRVDRVVRPHGFQPVALHLDCPSEVARERISRDIAANVHLARDRTPDVVGEVLARMEPPPPGTLSIDATLPAVEVCRLAVASIAALAGIDLDLRR
ncbi:AAA family ATPase [Tahibacter amnicola]|uniref:ATP-binding protein n=1 Tax=Tahibacter amnicola TaxID=2976241 RepID=A0ABY6BQ60_9GAMM|nr:ATP-binding protein [Tahibacter amnicola]UXI69912.1 ATP-binding protein [Tahibacter amnicola]